MKTLCLLMMLLIAPSAYQRARHLVEKPEYKLLAKYNHQNTSISVYKNIKYNHTNLEVLFKAMCYNSRNKTSRDFYITKTDNDLFEKTLSNFAMIEYTAHGNNLVYPFGWESEKIICSEIKENSILILRIGSSPFNRQIKTTVYFPNLPLTNQKPPHVW